MENISCDIIKDLMPSYADGICSEATEKCVEEHIEGCSKCRQALETYKNRTLSGDKLEQKELDGLKKIKNVMKFQKLVCYGILVFMVYCGIQIFFANHGNYVIFNQLSLLFVICIFVILLSGMGYKGKNALGRTEYLFGAVSFVLDAYFILLFIYFATQLTPGVEQIFGRELVRTGPFMERQIKAAFLLQLAFFIYNLWCIIKRDKNCNWLLCLNIMGIFLVLNYDLWMRHMTEFYTMQRTIIIDTLEIVIPGIVGTIASLLVTRGVRKKPNGT